MTNNLHLSRKMTKTKMKKTKRGNNLKLGNLNALGLLSLSGEP